MALATLMPDDQVTLDLRAAEVEVAILEAQRLGGFFFAVQHKWEWVSLGKDGEVRGHHLHVASGQVGIGAAGRALDDRTADGNDVLTAESARLGMSLGR